MRQALGLGALGRGFAAGAFCQICRRAAAVVLKQLARHQFFAGHHPVHQRLVDPFKAALQAVHPGRLNVHQFPPAHVSASEADGLMAPAALLRLMGIARGFAPGGIHGRQAQVFRQGFAQRGERGRHRRPGFDALPGSGLDLLAQAAQAGGQMRSRYPLQLGTPRAGFIERAPLAGEFVAVQLTQGVEQVVDVVSRGRGSTRLRACFLLRLALGPRRRLAPPER